MSITRNDTCVSDINAMAHSSNTWMEDAARQHMIDAYEAHINGLGDYIVADHINSMESLLEDLGEACRGCFDAEDLIHEDMPITKKAAYFVMRYIEKDIKPLREYSEQ